MARPRRRLSHLPPVAWTRDHNGRPVAERWGEARPREFPDYLVSTFGRVWNARSGRLLKPHSSPGARSPYPKVRLSDGAYSTGPRRGQRKHRTYYVHRLVALAFVPGRSVARWQVHHVDGDTYNAAAENLRWMAPRDHEALHSDSAPVDIEAVRAEMLAELGEITEAPF